MSMKLIKIGSHTTGQTFLPSTVCGSGEKNEGQVCSGQFKVFITILDTKQNAKKLIHNEPLVL